VFERFSTAGRRAVYSARREAGLVGSKIIGSEHLLLGLLRVDPATFEFIPQPVTLVSLRRAAVRWHMPGEKLLNSMDLPISEDVKLAFNNAVSLAEAHGSSFVRTEHLLLALTTVRKQAPLLPFSNNSCQADKILEINKGLNCPATTSSS
jgi:ATP-dependent Clp protease ATP-binding subunit ClpA